MQTSDSPESLKAELVRSQQKMIARAECFSPSLPGSILAVYLSCLL